MADYTLTQTGAEVQEILDSVGDLDNLTTTAKTTLVDAVNEVDGRADAIVSDVGDKSDLDTTDKSNLVAAINENVANIDKQMPRPTNNEPIWENPDNTAAMAGTTLQIDCSAYTWFLVEYCASANATNTRLYSYAIQGCTCRPTYSAPSYSYARSVTFNGASGIVVGDGTRIGTGTNNTFMIPNRIWGLW